MRCIEVRGFLESYTEEPDSVQLSELRLHSEGCEGCRAMYQNWLISDSLIKCRSAETLEPTPFVETRIVAAIRAAKDRSKPAFLAALWQKAGVVLTSIVALVVILVSLTLISTPSSIGNVAQDVSSVSSGSYSAEQVVMGDPGSVADDNLTNTQVADTLFNTDN